MSVRALKQPCAAVLLVFLVISVHEDFGALVALEFDSGKHVSKNSVGFLAEPLHLGTLWAFVSMLLLPSRCAV